MKEVRKHLRWYLLITLILSNFFIWQAVFAGERNGVLTVAFLNVGQGDAIYIEAPNGNQVLIDGGSGKAVLRELGSIMPSYDMSIDVVVATHPDKDHIGGLVDVIERYDVDLILESGAINDTGVHRSLHSAIEQRKVESVLAKRGINIVLDEGVYLKILFPDRDVLGMDPNDASIIAQLVYGEIEFLFTGDSPKKIENHLAYIDAKNLQSDVLKVGHHGSRTSSSELFVGFVSPKYAVISAGENNRYGHPHSEVLELFNKFEIPIFSTQNGTIIFKSDGENIFLK